MKVIYSRRPVAEKHGLTAINPSYYIEPLQGVTDVFLDGEEPKIKKDYEDIGVKVHSISELKHHNDQPNLPLNSNNKKGS